MKFPIFPKCGNQRSTFHTNIRVKGRARLSDKILDFLNDDKRTEFRKKAREYYEEYFSVDIVMDKLEEVLKDNCR